MPYNIALGCTLYNVNVSGFGLRSRSKSADVGNGSGVSFQLFYFSAGKSFEPIFLGIWYLPYYFNCLISRLDGLIGCYFPPTKIGEENHDL